MNQRFLVGTIGQHLTNIRLRSEENGALSLAHIIRRFFVVFFRILLVFIPGPNCCNYFLLCKSSNPKRSPFSHFIIGSCFGLFYRSFTKYRQGQTQSLGDRFSRTCFIDISKRKKETE